MCHFYNSRLASRLAFLKLSIILSSLLSGCASETLSLSSDTSTDSHQLSAPRQNAAYNRPYKIRGKTYYPMTHANGYSEQGIASWYGYESGNRTSMGTPFKPHAHTAAHKTLPLPSKVRVTNLQNGRSIIVVVNDRGSFKKNRLIDLSQGAAKKIGVHGLAIVKVEYIGKSLTEND